MRLYGQMTIFGLWVYIRGMGAYMQVAYIREEKHFNSQSVNLLLFIAFSRFCNKQLLQMIRIKFTLSYIFDFFFFLGGGGLFSRGGGGGGNIMQGPY